MKRWLVVLLVVLAVVVLVSPGIIGRLAEKSLKDSVTWARYGNDDYVVTQERFERGWFTTAGGHRVEFRRGRIHDAIAAFTDRQPDEPLPALIVDTRIDHGLVPVTSMSRKAGTLKPQLASTVSTMELDLGDGELLDVPGTLYSNIGLTGETASSYLLGAGTYEKAEMRAGWDGAAVMFTTDPASRSLEYEGRVEPFEIGRDDGAARVEGMTFNGNVDKTGLGLHVGSVALDVGRTSVDAGARATAEFDAASVRLDSDLDDAGRLNGRSEISVTGFVLPEPGEEIDLQLELALNRLDARLLQAILAVLRETPAAASGRPPNARYPTLENDLRRLLSAGGELRVDRFDLRTRQGEVAAELRFNLPESDAVQAHSWASLLLALTASAEIELSAALVERVMAANPDARALIAMGILERDGDVYGLDAEYAQGLLTVNGAPMPIPLPGRQ